jgi:hypothetical protein
VDSYHERVTHAGTWPWCDSDGGAFPRPAPCLPAARGEACGLPLPLPLPRFAATTGLPPSGAPPGTSSDETRRWDLQCLPASDGWLSCPVCVERESASACHGRTESKRSEFYLHGWCLRGGSPPPAVAAPASWHQRCARRMAAPPGQTQSAGGATHWPQLSNSPACSGGPGGREP